MNKSVKLEQDFEVLKQLLKVSEPKTQEYYDKLWRDYGSRGSVQSRKNTKRYAEERSKK